MNYIKDKNGLNEHHPLKQYNSNVFAKPSVTVDMLIFTILENKSSSYRKLSDKKLGILLIKRRGHPYLGSWALPGGFVEIDESLYDAAKRELLEETGLKDIYMEQLYTWGEINRDPRMRVISVSYMGLVNSKNHKLIAGTDADNTEWFIIDGVTIRSESQGHSCIDKIHLTNGSGSTELSAEIKCGTDLQGKEYRGIIKNKGIAFDHAKIISMGLERLRNNTQFADLPFNLVPDQFTLTELQQVYETILGVELSKTNFRRKIAPMVTETDYEKRDAGHRPAKLYTYNSQWKERLFIT
jgi:8-oxo-dGTP diphosphatase